MPSCLADGQGLGLRRTLGPLVPTVGDGHCTGMPIASVSSSAGFQSRLQGRNGPPILVYGDDSRYSVCSVGYVSCGP